MIYAIVSYCASILGLSVASFMTYEVDKKQAIKGGRRVPEYYLQFLSLLGGWPGALLGQRWFRHKTRKTRFLFVFWIMVVLHFAMVGSVASIIVIYDSTPRRIKKPPSRSRAVLKDRRPQFTKPLSPPSGSGSGR